MDKKTLKKIMKERTKIFWNENTPVPINIDEIVERYFSLDLDMNITDIEMRRVCSAMNRIGVETISSCVGHKESLPHIFFRCDDCFKLVNFKSILYLKGLLLEPWIIGYDHIGYDNEGVYILKDNEIIHIEDDKPIKLYNSFVLNPVDSYGLYSDIEERYNRAVIDLDLIGATTIQQFS